MIFFGGGEGLYERYGGEESGGGGEGVIEMGE